jgi:hypothetical protein
MDPVKDGRAAAARAHARSVTRTAEPPHARPASLLDRLTGGSRWGRFDVWPTRYGFTHYRLVVLPPGATGSDRVLLELWRSAAVIAALAGLALFVAADLAGLRTGPSSVAGLLAGGAVASALALVTRRLRPQVRTCAGGIDDAGGRARSVGEMTAIEQWSILLLAADRALQAGEVTAVQHELIWTRAWRALDRPAR